MCGIAGIIHTNSTFVQTTLAAMITAEQHRGPDDRGFISVPFGNQMLGLGHCRLSILDLSNAGHQPLIHPITGDLLIFNGEIYNYQELKIELKTLGSIFRGNSDSEVLLHALSRWGTSVISRLRGMFAFAFFNRTASNLILARDALGIKPLYYGQTHNQFVFASEVRSILAAKVIPITLDMQGVTGYLSFGAVQHPLTLIKDIHSLPPGSWQSFSPAEHGITANPIEYYWSYPAFTSTATQRDAIAGIQESTVRAVKEHLVSDVSVGLFLSSGIDSTILAGIASQQTHKLRCFTVAISTAGSSQVQDNVFSSCENQLATETAKLFGLQHQAISIGPAEVEKVAETWIQSVDQPSIDGLNTFLITRAVRKEGIKVALSGLGADELFGGYPSFRDVPLLKVFFQLCKRLPYSWKSSMPQLISRTKSPILREKLVDILATNGSLLSLYLQRRRLLSNTQLKNLGLTYCKLGLTPDYLLPATAERLESSESDTIGMISRFESELYQGNMLLRDADSNSMFHGLELRVPFLDKRIIDFVHTLPGNLRFSWYKPRKLLLRKSFPSYLRPALLQQHKKGFVLPIWYWMRNSLRSVCEYGISLLKNASLLEGKAIDELWNHFLNNPNSPVYARALALCTLGLYLKKIGISS